MTARFLSLAIILTFSLLQAVMPAAATGRWEFHAAFHAPPQKVIDTGKKVFYLSGGSLFSYNKENGESFSYTPGNRLNGVTVSDIFLDSARKRLLVAYTTGNIDIIDSDDNVMNFPDISESNLAPPLTINDAAFDGDRMFAATAFGLVEFSTSKNEVVQSGIYGKPVTAVAVSGEQLLIASDGHLLFKEKTGRFPSLSYFTVLSSPGEIADIIPLDNDRAILLVREGDGTKIVRVSIDYETRTLTEAVTVSSHNGRFYLTKASDGNFHYICEKTLYLLDAGALRETPVADLPEDFDGAVAGTATGSSEIWSLTRSGLACHDFSGSRPTLLTERFRPEQLSVREVCHFFPTADGHRLYAMNNGSTAYRFDRPGSDGFIRPLTLSVIDLESKKTTDLTPWPVEAFLPLARERQKIHGRFILGPTSVAEDPADSECFYVSTSTDGIYIFRGGELAGRYNEENSPLERIDERNIAYHVSIDRGGNLWLSGHSEGNDSGPVFILPAEKRELAPDKVKKTDWIPFCTKENIFPGTHDVIMLHCRRSDFIFRLDAYDHFTVRDTRGTYADLSDDDYRVIRNPQDQDGHLFSPERYSAICEDRNGSVWIGTDIGIIEISDPSSALSDMLTVRRLKVPRGDGSGMADYLLGNELIYGITADAANRKWIATEKSGLYLVSPDGSEILQHFTADNSPLPSNTVYCVFSDPSGAEIYIGTPEGLCTYESDATPPRDDYSDITVYPNPVRPDYTGAIHIRGLMEGSLVKIADAAGSVIFQGRPEGGLLTWDGLDSTGNRLPTGIYYVFVSSPDGRHSATSKFMIVN